MGWAPIALACLMALTCMIAPKCMIAPTCMIAPKCMITVGVGMGVGVGRGAGESLCVRAWGRGSHCRHGLSALVQTGMTTDRAPGAGSATTGGGYRTVLAASGMKSLYAVGVLARIPFTGTPMALLLHVTDGLGRGYAAAGLVTAAVTVGIAVGSPWRGRVIDRLGLRRALVPSLVAVPLLWSAAVIVPYPVLVPVALLGGLLAVPVFTVIRQAIPVLLPPADRRAGYALDSVLVEVSYLIGPAGAILLATTAGTEVAVLTVGFGGVVAGLLLAWLNPPVRSTAPTTAAGSTDADRAARGEAHRRATDDPVPGRGSTGRRRFRRPAWLTPGVLAMYATAAGGAFAVAGTEVGVLATLREADRTVWVAALFAIWGVASGVGGLAFGAWRGPVPSPLVLLGLLGVATVPLAAADGPLLLALLLLPAGALIAPTLSASAEGLSRRAPEAVRGEAMGWHSSATTTGFSLGAPVAGLLVDLAGPGAAFVGVGALAGGAAVGVWLLLSRRSQHLRDVPDLR